MPDWENSCFFSRVERERATNPDADGFIIPVLFRGDKEKLAEFRGSRQIVDFRHIVKPAIQLDTIASRRTLEETGQRVARLAARHSPTDCSKFAISIGVETAQPSLHADPNPLA